LLSINKTESAIATFNRFQVDAILVFGENEDAIQHSTIKSTIPIVYYGIQANSRFPTIDVNRRIAIKLAANYLQDIGHQHIAFIGDLTDPLQKDKLTGFLEAMKLDNELELPNFIIPTKGLEVYDGYLAAKNLLSQDIPVTAIISGSYDLTRGILRATSELSLKIPDDLSIISYDNIPQFENLEVQLTTVGVPISRISQKISETLLAIMEDEPVDETIILDPELNIIDSCSPVNK